MARKKKTGYSEPASYFPKSIRKEFGLGEYFDSFTEKEQKTKVTAKKKK